MTKHQTQPTSNQAFFTTTTFYSGPPLEDWMILQAESTIGGYRLPTAYISLLRIRNGGVPRRSCCPTPRSTIGWASDHIEIRAIRGLGGEYGIDAKDGFDSLSLIQEWGYPAIGVVFCLTPAGGHDAVMLDYSGSGPRGEPRVVYVDEDRSVMLLAETFEEFLAKLYTVKP